MARKSSKPGEANKSQAIRDLLAQTPEIKANDAISALKAQGIKADSSLFYFIKGKLKGKKGRKKKARQMVASVTATMGRNGIAPAKQSDAVATIIKIKHVAAELGGLKKLKALVEALSQ